MRRSAFVCVALALAVPGCDSDKEGEQRCEAARKGAVEAWGKAEAVANKRGEQFANPKDSRARQGARAWRNHVNAVRGGRNAVNKMPDDMRKGAADALEALKEPIAADKEFGGAVQAAAKATEDAANVCATS